MAEINILAVISKLRPKIKRNSTIELDDIADDIAVQSGFDRGDARDFAYKLARALVKHLRYGHYVRLGEIGGFSVTCDKNKKVKVSYRTSATVKKVLAEEFRGEFINNGNAGLDDEGFAQLWLEQNPGDIVIMRDGTTRPV
jgi:predicted histone-like DNA-binding protein